MNGRSQGSGAVIEAAVLVACLDDVVAVSETVQQCFCVEVSI